MNIELMILIGSIAFTVLILPLLIKRDRLLDALISFSVMQAMTWLFGALVVEERLIEYPADFFNFATRTSFTFEYFIFPAVGAIFNVHYPRGSSRFVQALYILGIPGAITAAEVLIEHYTKIIDYVDWKWEYSFLSMTATLLLSYGYYRWFIGRIRRSRLPEV
ncbi:CBO0543 family protein [Paenibacillus humicola]|uniref:CBO0543 family protein n=1 Tax=Paenibacillus humicola TaxID=3110540 RepID=UPI00237A0ABC|nr:CBO0543 family protein [Paenibacillus humicola]